MIVYRDRYTLISVFQVNVIRSGEHSSQNWWNDCSTNCFSGKHIHEYELYENRFVY